ncbi:prepilin peptidase [Pandoraea sp. PE-S2T-3]|uniref:prepilin peptidase n=1 Tax=Pandoraea sp. PE-S2T-3 TaxID=1986993 RepID=UPI000B3FB41C|nr:A24 family peptidase [Pandoraea sp. PE-S2T-3]
MNGYAEPLLIDFLAQLAPHWRFALFAAVGIVAGLFLDIAIRRVPVAVELAWLAESATATTSATSINSINASASALSPDHGDTEIPLASITALSAERFQAVPLPDAAPTRRWQLSVLTALLSVAVAWRFGPTWQSVGALGLVWTLITLAYIDFDTQLLPDILTLPLLWAGLLCNLGHWFATLPAAVIGAAAGYLSLWLLYWVYWLLRRREGMGFGDFKLYAALGAWLGWASLLQIMTLACLLAIVVAGSAWIAGQLRHDQMFPFGAFLAAGGIATLFGGNELMMWIGGTP